MSMCDVNARRGVYAIVVNREDTGTISIIQRDMMIQGLCRSAMWSNVLKCIPEKVRDRFPFLPRFMGFANATPFHHV